MELMDGLTPSSPRGTKRKADESNAPNPPRRIKPLAQDVINKIAAGEIIVAPVHALKELIENAVDAGSTSIEILIKEGGLKLLQITDNGHGIHKEDMPLLCERFTTSKLKVFEDLSSIGTYGFRGEALASISHIAHLTVTTRTSDTSCAYRALYEGGKLVPMKPGQSADPKPTAGRQGTQLTVEDLFYNMENRRRSFRSASEEYAKIVELVGKYAVHCTHVAFTCKKHGDSNMSISIPANAGTIDRIRQIHTNGVANELVEYKASSQTLGFEAKGYISNANYSIKRTTLLLFINHRSVESTPIRKAIEQTYATFLPKGGRPFVYLSLEIEPQRVDVNVHPTKREVRFLHEDEIIEVLCDQIRITLASVDTSRTFMTQSLLPGARTALSNQTMAPPQTPAAMDRMQRTPASKTVSGLQKTYEHDMIRTDSKARKITSMLTFSRNPSLEENLTGTGDLSAEPQYEYTDREQVICRLTTVKDLRAEVRENMHDELTDVFASHTFVGVVDEQRRIAAIQGGVKLYLLDYGMICNEYFYQLGLTDFGNFGIIRLKPPLDLRDLLKLGVRQLQQLEQPSNNPDLDEIVTKVHETLMSRRAMLSEYFNLAIDDEGQLEALPLMIKGYQPSMAKLPTFLIKLGPYVDWTDEKACFHTFLQELASWYVPEALPPPPRKKRNNPAQTQRRVDEPSDGHAQSSDVTMGDSDEQMAEDPALTARRKQIHRSLENVLFPAFKTRLVATKGLLKGVLEVANLKGLYRVFERC